MRHHVIVGTRLPLLRVTLTRSSFLVLRSIHSQLQHVLPDALAVHDEGTSWHIEADAHGNRAANRVPHVADHAGSEEGPRHQRRTRAPAGDNLCGSAHTRRAPHCDTSETYIDNTEVHEVMLRE